MMIFKSIPQPVELIRSRRKTLSVSVAPDGRVILRVPMRTGQERIERFLADNAGWIDTHVRRSIAETQRIRELPPITAAELESLAKRAAAVIPERAEYYAPLIGVTYGRITVRNQRSKWGSCTAKGNLSFNCLLMLAPPEVLDSVVVHELCHRKHMNHSKAFYEEVYRVFPDYDKQYGWLKEHGTELIRRMTGV